MRILLAGSYLPNPTQGSSGVLLRLSACFRAQGHQVDTLFLDVLPRWCRHYRVSWFLFPLVVLSASLTASWRGVGYEVLDISGGDAWLVGALRFLLRPRPVIACRSHGWEHEDYRVGVNNPRGRRGWRWQRGLLMRLCRLPMVASSVRLSDVTVVGSSPIRDFAVQRRWKSLQEVCVVPCGVDDAHFVANEPSQGRGLLFVGSWLERKGVFYLARAFESVRRSGYDIPLSIVGFGSPLEEVLRYFDPGVRSAIRIDERLRLVSQQDLIAEYRDHALLVFPSLYEGFGMVFLEGMASGLPVIATPVGGVVDVIRHEENGIIVPPGDAEALARAIMELWQSPEKRRRLGAAAQASAREFTWDRSARQTLQCYGCGRDRCQRAV